MQDRVKTTVNIPAVYENCLQLPLHLKVSYNLLRDKPKIHLTKRGDDTRVCKANTKSSLTIVLSCSLHTHVRPNHLTCRNW